MAADAAGRAERERLKLGDLYFQARTLFGSLSWSAQMVANAFLAEPPDE